MSSNHIFDKCLLCNTDNLLPLKGYQEKFLVKCSSCDFIFCQQKPSLEELKHHYGLYPRANEISKITIKRYEELLDSFERYRITNNIIDIGCGDGFFLEVAKKRGWNVYGTEFTQEAFEICERKGISMMLGSMVPNQYPLGFFDVLTSFEVIEHINTPQSELKHYFEIVRSGGIVYLTTPNFNSLSRYILKANWNVIEYPEHLSYYSLKTLTALFTKNNFELLSATSTGLSIRRLFTSSNTFQQIKSSSNVDEKIRESIEDSVIFRMVKNIINGLLNSVNGGDNLKVFFKKK